MGGRREAGASLSPFSPGPSPYFTFFKIAIRKSQYFSTVSM